MNSRDISRQENATALATITGSLRQTVLVWAVIFLGAAVTASLVLGYVNRNNTASTQTFTEQLSNTVKSVKVIAQSQCTQNRAVANAPLVSGTSPLGLYISAGARVAFIQAQCPGKPLDPADPRVIPLLPPGVR